MENLDSTNPYQAPAEENDQALPTGRTINPARKILWTLYGINAVSGVVQVFLIDSTVTETFFSLAMAFCATAWAVSDSRFLGRTFPGILRVLYFFTWPLAALIYLIATRGFFRGIGWWIVNVIGLIVTLLATFYPTLMLLYLLGWVEIEDFL